MNGCPHCKKILKELEKVSNSTDFIKIEKTDITSEAKEKLGIHVYPTLVFLTDTNKMIGKLEGYYSSTDINTKYRACERLDKLFKRTGKLY